MLKYCLDKWNANKDELEDYFRKTDSLYDAEYKDLVKLVITHILNPGTSNYDYMWNPDAITEIDNGDYQGTLLYLIPADAYQPNEYEYLMTFVNYGSCSGCDTLQSISPYEYRPLTDDEVKDYMTLCKDIVANIVKPYNGGWRQDDRFEVVTMEEI